MKVREGETHAAKLKELETLLASAEGDKKKMREIVEKSASTYEQRLRNYELEVAELAASLKELSGRYLRETANAKKELQEAEVERKKMLEQNSRVRQEIDLMKKEKA